MADSLWVATAVVRGTDVLGVAPMVAMPEDGPADWVGTSNDVALGTALGELSATEILISDEPNGAYYALDGSTVRPLNDWARRAFPRVTDVSVLQDVVAEQYAVLREQQAEPDGGEFPGQVAAIVGPVVIFVLVYGGITLIERRRGRSAAPA